MRLSSTTNIMTKEEQIIELESQAARIGLQCMDNFFMFFKTFWPEFAGCKYEHNWHIEFLCNTLEFWGKKLFKDEEVSQTICISVPPSSSKSTICTISFPLWCWLHRPDFTTVNISYSASLSKEHALKRRGVVDSKKFKVLFDNIFKISHGKTLDIVRQNEGEMLNNFKGSAFNASVGGSLTGKHANILIEDDNLSADGGNSEAEIRNANRYHDETVSTRKKNFRSFLNILIGQRLNENDTVGHVLRKNIPITEICLPGELTNTTKVVPEECRLSYVDGILDPGRKPKHILEILKAEMGAGAYSSQILQMPFDPETQAIKPSMFELIDPRDDMVFDMIIDSAYTEKTKNDATGIILCGYKDKTLYIKKAHREFMTLPNLVAFIKDLGDAGEFDPMKSRIFCEPKASGISLIQYLLNDTEYNAVLIGEHNKREAKLVQEGKTARHNLIQPKAASGRIKLFKGKWNDMYLNELVGFPKVGSDEFVDVTGYAVNHYFFKESTFIEEWALNKIEKEVIGSIPVLLTSQQVKSKNGNTTSMSVTYEENDTGDVQLFDYPNIFYHNRYITVVVMKSEAERNGTTCILVYDRVDKVVPAMFDIDSTNTRKIAMRALELSYLYSKAKLVVSIKKTITTSQNEEFDQGHLVLQEIRRIGYNNLYSRLTVNNIKKKRERVFGFEVTRSTSREIYLHLKGLAETNKIGALPMEVFNDISLLERRKEDGTIGGQEGHEVNTALAYAIALKVSQEWSDSPVLKRANRDKWA